MPEVEMHPYGQPPEQRAPTGLLHRKVSPWFLLAIVAIVGLLILSVPATISSKDAGDFGNLRQAAKACADADVWTKQTAATRPDAKTRRGKDTWTLALEVDELLLLQQLLVSYGGEDTYAQQVKGRVVLGDMNCSYTAPYAAMLDKADAGAKLPKRCIMFCFNARNWRNYPDKGVLIIWSDREEPEWLTLDQASADWGITAEEWADPAGKLFGKKAPFQHTYE